MCCIVSVGRLVAFRKDDLHRSKVDEVGLSSTCLPAPEKHRRWGPGSLISASFSKLFDAIVDETLTDLQKAISKCITHQSIVVN